MFVLTRKEQLYFVCTLYTSITFKIQLNLLNEMKAEVHDTQVKEITLTVQHKTNCSMQK